MMGMVGRPTVQRALIVVGLLLLAAVLLVTALLVAPSSKRAQEQFQLEVAKAFVQLAVIAVLGGLVAALLRYVESLREENRRLHDYWASLFREVVTAYNGIKAVRRSLRAWGFKSSSADYLSAEQVEQFRLQMNSLLTNQLSLESIGRELRTSPAADAQHARHAIRTVEKYVHDIIRDWEDHGRKITEGVPSSQLNDLQHLRSFLEPATQGFKRNATEPMELLEQFIRSKLGTPGHRESHGPGLREFAAHRAGEEPGPS